MSGYDMAKDAGYCGEEARAIGAAIEHEYAREMERKIQEREHEEAFWQAWQALVQLLAAEDTDNG